jgi:hypothetical protein
MSNFTAPAQSGQAIHQSGIAGRFAGRVTVSLYPEQGSDDLPREEI